MSSMPSASPNETLAATRYDDDAHTLSSSWRLVDGAASHMSPDERAVRDIAAAAIRNAIADVHELRRAGVLSGMRITSRPLPFNWHQVEVGELITFLCTSALDRWIALFDLAVTADEVRAHLRIHEPACALATLDAWRRDHATASTPRRHRRRALRCSHARFAAAITLLVTATLMAGCRTVPKPSARYPIVHPIDPVTEETLDVRH